MKDLRKSTERSTVNSYYELRSCSCGACNCYCSCGGVVVLYSNPADKRSAATETVTVDYFNGLLAM